MRRISFGGGWRRQVTTRQGVMFPGSESFTCGENKTTAYLAKYGIASFIKRELSRSISDKQYVLMFDESEQNH